LGSFSSIIYLGLRFSEHGRAHGGELEQQAEHGGQSILPNHIDMIFNLLSVGLKGCVF
jgi:hypothetical protein